MRASIALVAGVSITVVGAGCTSHRPALPAMAPAAGSDPIDRDGLRLAVAPSDEITEVDVRSEPWDYAGYEGQVLITPHYRLYTTLTQHVVLEHLPLFLERGLAQYTTALGKLPAPPARLETYLFETRNQWEAKTRQILPEQAATFLTLGRGGFTTRGLSVLYYIGRTDTLAIAAHEGWHQYAQRTLKDPLPLWLEEGVAAYMEGFVSHPDGLPKFRPWANLERYHTLRTAARADKLFPLEDLLGHAPQSFLADGKNRLLVYYAQVWALLHFLAEGEHGRYLPGLRQVLLDAAEGRLRRRLAAAAGRYRRPDKRRLGPGAVEAYFDTDLRGFEQRYFEFVHEIVKTGGRSRIVEGRSPLS